MSRFPHNEQPTMRSVPVEGLPDLVQEMRQLTAAINRMAETNEKVVQALMQVVAEGEGEEEGDQPQPQRYLDGTLIS